MRENFAKNFYKITINSAGPGLKVNMVQSSFGSFAVVFWRCNAGIYYISAYGKGRLPVFFNMLQKCIGMNIDNRISQVLFDSRVCPR